MVIVIMVIIVVMVIKVVFVVMVIMVIMDIICSVVAQCLLELFPFRKAQAHQCLLNDE